MLWAQTLGSPSNTDPGAQGGLASAREKAPCPGGRAGTPSSGWHGLDKPGGCRSHLGPCLASHQDKNPTLSISSGTNVKVQMWGTAVASVSFLWGLRRALCLPAPLFLKLGTRLAHRPLQIPLPPSILPSCTWPFSQEDLPSDQCGHLGSSLRSLLPRRAPNEIWGWGWGWEAGTSADRAWPWCGPVRAARLCMVAIWGPGRADLSPRSSHPSVEHGDMH